MKIKNLKKSGFKNITNESGASVLELSISKKIKIRTWGNSEDGRVKGIYLYNTKTNKYTNEINFV